MSIKVNDKVRVDTSMGYLSNVMGLTGTVIQVYDFLVPMAIVKFENGITAKVEVSNLIKVEAQENQEAKLVTPEIPEGAKRITKSDFEAALMAVANPVGGMSERNPMAVFVGSMTAMIVGKNVAAKIFKDQDSVVMTEDQFTAALWDGCNPENVSESVGEKIPVSKCMRVSITAIISLENIVGVLFSDNSDNA